MKHTIYELKTFLTLWATQSLSQLGSAMTSFALTLWLYQKTGSALQTALLSICSYAPYVVLSIFAGALSDRWDKKKTMLACDTFAASLLSLISINRDSLEVTQMCQSNCNLFFLDQIFLIDFFCIGFYFCSSLIAVFFFEIAVVKSVLKPIHTLIFSVYIDGSTLRD